VDEHAIRIGGQDISYLESHGGGRPVVFVHGNSCSARTWRPLLDGPFGGRFRCLALDLPGHGHSARAADHARYSLPGYAAILAGFAESLNAAHAVVVGWSLGGHIALEAAPAMPAVSGFVIFGTPPVRSASQLSQGFLPIPATGVGFTEVVSEDAARSFAACFTAPGSTLPLDEFVADILATDGAARASMFASVRDGRFADQLAIIARMRQPLAILHGEGEQLANLDYIKGLTVPSLWRGQVQLIAGAGHAPHRETPVQFAELLEQFIADLDD
jgi:pimeloyl-ACP methyl ester carboxylesterase